MDDEFGYTDVHLSYVTDYAQEIQQQTNHLEFIWWNRKTFKDEIDLNKVIADKVREIKRLTQALEDYLEPTEDGE